MTAEGAPSIRAHVASLPTSRYRYDASADAWTVAPGARRLLGLGTDEPLDVARLLNLLRDEEREQVARFVFDSIRGRVPFSTLLHVLRPDGEVRQVLVVGEGSYEGETLVAVHGHVVDVGALGADQANERVDRAVAEVVANRATIEQAKGALSLAYGFDGDGAIALLRWWSSHRNVKVNVLANRLVTAAGAGAVSTPQLRAAVDGLLAATSAPEAPADDLVD